MGHWEKEGWEGTHGLWAEGGMGRREKEKRNAEGEGRRGSHSRSHLADVTVLLFSVCGLSQAINRRRIKSGPDMQPITYYIDPSGTPHE